jgi:hypothetical protein
MESGPDAPTFTHNFKVDESDNTVATELYDTDSLNRINLSAKGTVDYSLQKTHYVYDERESGVDGSDPSQILKHLDMQAADMMDGFAKKNNEWFLTLATAPNTTNAKPKGLPYWVVKSSSTASQDFGFNGSKVLDDAKAIGAGVIAAIQTIGDNWGTIIDRMLTSSDLFWEQLYSSAEHFAFTRLPYIAENMVGIFQHAFTGVANNARTQFEYIVTSGMEAIGAVPKGTADFQLGENKQLPRFEPTPLPEMASRRISAKELDIQSKLANLDKGLGDAFKKNFDKAFQSLDTVIADQRSVFNIDLKSKAPPVAAEVVAEQEKKAKAADTNLQAVQSRLLTRGPMQDSSKFIAQNTAQAAQTLKLLLAEQRAERERNRLKGRTTNLVVVGGGSVGGVN